MNAAAGASTCTVSIDVTSATAAAYVNGAAQVTVGGVLTNSVTNQTLTVVQASLNKAFAPTAIDVGGTSTLTFTITNGAGNPAQSGINFTDNLPANVVVAGTPNIQTNCPAGGALVNNPAFVTAAAASSTVTVTGLAMNAALASCQVKVDVTSATSGGPYNNTAANISGTARITNSVTASGLTVQSLPALTKAFVPATAGVGRASSLTFTITNPAGSPARTGLTFTDNLPAGVLIAAVPNVVNSCGGAPTITATAGTGTFTIGGSGVNAAAGPSTCTVSVDVSAAATGSFVNGAAQVTVGGVLTNGVTNQTLTVVQASLNKAFFPTTISMGATSTLTFTLTNGAGNPAESGINFTDTLPANVTVAAAPNITTTCPSGTGVVTAAAGSGTITVTGASMSAAMASCAITVDVTATVVGGPYTNTAANISATAHVTNAVTGSGLTVQTPSLSKAFAPATIGIGQASTLTFTVTNAAGSPARTGVTFTDNLPANVVIAGAPAVVNSCGGAPTITANAGSSTFIVAGGGVNAAAGPSTCTVTVNVTSNVAGVYTNGAGNVTTGGGLTNGVTNQTLTVQQGSLNKAFAPTAIDVNGTSTLTFTLTNSAGNPAQTGINFTDTLPANVVVAAAPNVTTTCPSGTGVVTAAAGSGSITVTGASLAAAQASCAITVDVTSSVIGGPYNNTAANITGVAGIANGVTSSGLTVRPVPALTKAFGPTTIGVGQASTLTFTVTNPNGSIARTGLTFSDALPAGVVIAATPNVVNTCGGAPTVTATAGTGTFTIGGGGVNAAVGPSSCTVSVDVTSAAANGYTNASGNVTVGGVLTNGVTNQTLTVVQASLDKSFAPATISQNGTSTITFTLTNGPGNPAQGGINFTDTLPSAITVAAAPNITTTCPSGTGVVTAAAGGGTITVTGASMSAAQASCVITIDVTSATTNSNCVANPATHTNTGANIGSTARVTTSGVSTACLTVQSLPALTKAFVPSTVGVGQASTLTFTITNPAATPARTGLTFSDTLPGSVVIAATPNVVNNCGGAPAVTATAGTGTFTIGGGGVNAAAGVSTCTVTVDVVSPSAGAFVNGNASVTTGGGLTNGVTNQTLTVGQASLNKAFAPATINVNGTSTLTFTLTNAAGNPAQTGINFTDTLPANVVVAATPNVTSTCPSGAGVVTAAAASATITVTGASMNSAQASCVITVDVTSSVVGGPYTNAAANITGTARVTNGVTASSLTVQAVPSLAKAFSPATIGVGQVSTLTFTISNPAGAPARSGLTFSDALPGGVVIAAVPNVVNGCAGTPAFTATAGTGTFTVAGGGVSAAAGASTCTVSVDVTAAAANAYVNGAAQVTVGGALANGVTNQTLTVTQSSLDKTFSPIAIDVGGTSTLTFTITNGAGNPAQSGINFTDTLPANVVVAGTPNIQSNCPAGGAFANNPAFASAAAGSSTVTVTGASLSNGVASCAVRVDVTSNIAGGPYSNTAANISATARITNSVVGTSLTVQNQPTLTKAFALSTAGVGQVSTLTFTVTNPAGSPARVGLTFSDALPANVVIAATPNVVNGCGGAPTITATAGTGTFTIGGSGVNAAAGASTCAVSVDVVSNTAGAYVNGAAQVTVGGPLVNAVTNQTFTVVQASLNKAFAPTTIDVGGTTTLTFTVTNGAGNPAQTGINFTDSLPANVVVAATPNVQSNCPAGGAFANNPAFVTAAAASSTITVTGLAMSGGVASCQVRVDAVSNVPGGPYTNAAANISATARVTNSVTASSVTVQGVPALTKAFAPASIGVGQVSTLTFTVTNPAGSPARSALTFSDGLPAGVVIAPTPNVVNNCGGTPTVTATAGTGSFNVAGSGVNAAAGASTCTVSVDVTSSAAAAYVNGNGNVIVGGVLTNNVTNQTLTVGQASLNKAFSPIAIDVGGTSTITFTLTNSAGNPAQSGINFTDTLPANVVVAAAPNVTTTCPSGTGAVTAAAASGTITVTGASMSAAQASCVVTVDVTSSVAGGPYTNAAANITATARVTNAVTASGLTVQQTPLLTKAFAPATLGVGQVSTLTFTITNPAGSPARTGLTFTDTLPAGLVIASPQNVVNGCAGIPAFTAVAGSGTFTVGGGGVSAAAGVSSCTVKVDVTSAAAAAYTNGSGNLTVGGTLANGVTNQTVTFVQASLNKAFAPAAINVGGTSTLTFTITNGAGNPAQSGINFTDTLPANVVVAAAPNVTTSCPSGTGAVTAAAASGTITVTGASMSAAQASCTITVDVTSNVAGGPYNNTAANISGTARVTNAVTSSGLTVQPLASLTKAFAPSTAGVGQVATLTFTITNPAGAPARTGLTFSDAMPAGLVIAATPNVVNGCGGAPTVTATAGTGTFAIGGAGVNAAAGASTCAVSVDVTSTTAGGYVNGAAQVTVGGTLNNNVTNQTLTIVQASLNKAFVPAAIDVGGTSTLTFTLTNGAGNPAQSGINFIDTLPANVVIAAAPNVTTTCPSGTGVVAAAAAGSTITVTGASMSAAQASCVITVDVTSSVQGGPYTNAAANITGTARVTNAVTPSSLTVQGQPVLTKAFVPATVGQGQASTLTFTIANPAGSPARTGLTFTDNLPAGVLIAATPNVVNSCGGAPTVSAVAGAGTFSIGGSGVNAAAGASTCTVSVDVSAAATGSFVNGAAQVTVGGVLLNGVTNQTLTVGQASLNKAFNPNSIDVGATATLTFTLTNSPGNPSQSGINFTDTLPANVVVAATPNVTTTCPSGTGVVTAAAGSGTITVTGASMNAAQPSCLVTVDVTSSVPGGPYTNAAANMSALARIANGVTASSLTVQPRAALTKAFSTGTMGVGQVATLTFTITNPAGAPARTGLTFNDTLPAGLVIAATPNVNNACGGTPTITGAAGAGTFSVGGSGVNVASGASCTVAVDVTASAAASYVNGAAQVTVGGLLNNGVTNQTLAVVQASLNKAFAPATIAQNGVSTLTFTLTNGAGNPAQTGINFTDTLPANVVVAAAPNVITTCPSGTGAVAAAAGGGTITVTGASMSGSQASCVVTVDVTSSVVGGPYTNAAANISGTARVTNAVTASSLTVQSVPALTKAFAPSTAGVGQSSTLTFTITNPAGAPARTGLTFSDALPAGLVIAAIPNVLNTCGGAPTVTATSGTGTFAIGGAGVNAAAGASSCTVSVDVSAAAAGGYVNGAAQVTVGGVLTNNVTNQTLTVTQASLNKAFAPTAIISGGTSTLTFTITNGAGNPAQTGINFTDTLPANVVVAATPNITTTCPSGTGVVSAAAASGTITVTGATMAAAQASCVVTVDVTSSVVGGPYTNAAANISATARITNSVTASSLSVQSQPVLTKAFSTATLGVGQVATLTFTITNPAGAPSRTGLTFTDVLPAGLVIASPQNVVNGCAGIPSFTAVAGSGTFTVGGGGVSAAAGASSCTVKFDVTSATAAAYTNGAPNVTVGGVLTNGITDQTITVSQASLNKAFSPTAIDVGGTSTLTFTITNGAGNPAQSGINFTDTLPANVVVAAAPNVTTTCPSGTGAVTAAAASGTITVTGASMSAAQASCVVTVDVTSSVAGGPYTNAAANITATARVTNAVTASSLTVQSLAALTKAFAPSTIGVGRTSTLTFTVTNPAGAPARTGITFSDALPAGVVIAATPNVVNGCGGAPTITAAAGAGTFTLGGSGVNAAAGASACTVSVDVTSGTAAAYVNGAAQVTVGGAITNGVTNQTLTVVQASLNKAFAPATINQNGTSTLTFTITNGAGNPAQSGINFTDTLPANVVIAATPNVTSNCPAGGGFASNPAFASAAAGGGTVTVTGAAMSNATASCAVTVDVTSSVVGGPYNNTAANMSALANVTNAVTGSGLTVQALVSLTKAFGPATVGLGQASTLTFTFANPAGAPGRSNLTLTDTLPAGLVIAATPNVVNTCGGAPTITAAAGTGTFTVGGSGVSVAGGSTCTVAVDVSSTAAAAYVNGAANVAVGGLVTNNVTNQTLTVSQASLNKAFAPAVIDVGGTSTLTFTLTNGAGNPAQGGINFTDNLPANVAVAAAPNVTTTCPSGSGAVTAAAGSGTITIAGATIAAAQGSCVITVDVTSNVPGGPYTNAAANITGTARIANAVTASSLTVQSLPALTKAFAPSTAGVGQAATLTFTITNPAGAPARTSLTFSDALPAGLVIAATPNVVNGCGGAPSITAGAGTGTFTLGGTGVNAAAGPSTCTVSVDVSSATAAAYVNGAAQVSVGGVLTNNVTNQTLTVVQASLNKAFAPATINQNGISTLTFTVTNGAGNPAQGGINFTDTLPANVVVAPTPNVTTTCPSGTGVVTAAAGSGTITVAGVSMSGSQASCVVTVDVTSGVVGGPYTNAAANISAMARITNSVTPSGLTVQSLPGLTKVFAPSTVGVGQSSTLTFTITNPAGAPARTGLTFTDTFPAGVVIAAAPGVVNNCGGAPTITAAAGAGSISVGGGGVNAAAGASSCTVTVNVTSAAAGGYVNGAAQVTVGGVLTNNVTNQTLTVTQASLNKAFAPTAIVSGGTSTLTFTITNGAGNPAQSGINFTDTLPANVVVAATPNITTSCPSGTGAVAAAAGSGTITVTGATMGAAQASCVVTVDVTSSVVGGPYTNAAANISGTARITNAVTASSLNVQSQPTLTKAFAASTLGVGQVTTLTFTVTNPAGAPARAGLTFSDALPAGLVIAATPNVVNGCGGAPTVTAAAGGGTFAMGGTGVNAAAGASNCTVSVDVTSATPAAYVNGAAQVTVGGVLVNGVTNQTLTVAQAALTKAFAPATISQGGVSTLTFTLTNGAGNPAQTGINFTDNLPANVVVAGTPNVTSTCPSGAGAVAAAAGSATITVTGASMSAAQASCVVTVDVTSNIVGGPYNNAAANITGTARVTNAVATTGLTVIAAPTAAKSFAPSTIAPNATSVLTIVLSNANGTAVTGAGFTDSYPAGLVNTATPNGTVSGAGCTGTVTAAAGAASAVLSGATIPAFSSCTVTVNVTAAAPGAYLNNTGPIATGNAGTGTSSSATLNVFAAPTVTKSFAPTSIPSGGTATMTIVVTNPAANPANLTNVVISDAYPAGLTNAAAGSVACSAGGGATLTGGVNGGTSVGFNAGTIPPNATCTITQTVTTTTSVTNTTSTATSTQAPAGTAASASLSVAGAPTIAKGFSPASIPLGATSTITFTITNPNGFALTNGAFTDTLSGMVIDSAGAAGGTCAGAGGNVFAASQTALSFTGLSIPATLSCTVTVVVRGTAVGANPNTTSGVSSTQAATGAVSNTATLTVTSVSPTIAKAFSPTSINPGQTSTLTITIGNNNGVPITVTSVTDTFPAGLTVAAAPNLATTCAGGTPSNTASSVTLTGGSVPANGTCTLTIDVTSVSAGAALINTIPAGGLTTNIGSNVVAATATLFVRPQADLSITKTAPATIANGAPITYTIVVANAGPQSADGAQLSDTVPAAVTGVGAVCGSPTGGAACGAVNVAGNAVTSTITTLPSGASVTFTVTGTAPQSGTFTNTASVITPVGVTDPNDPSRTGAGNNSASANTTVVSPDLRLTKSHAGTFTVGVNGVYTLTVDNTLGTAASTGTITVADTLPAGLTFVSATGTSWTCSAVGQAVTCTSNAVIAAGATSANPITLTVAVASTAVPSVTNQASVSGGGEPAANNGNNTAFDPTNVSAAAVNTFAPDNAQSGLAGTTVYYAHTFNAGSAGNVSFSTTSVATPAVAGWTQVIYRDTDCSGTLNGTEGSAPLSGAVAVAAGATVCIIVADNIPAAAPFNAQNVISVTSTFNSTQTITRTDTTTVAAAGASALQLAKAVRNVTQGTPAGTSNTAKPGDVLEYSVTYTNPAGGALTSIVITDATPAFTTFVSAACGAPLPAGITTCTVTTQPAVNASGSVVWTLAGSLPAGGSGTVLYQVRVAP